MMVLNENNDNNLFKEPKDADSSSQPAKQFTMESSDAPYMEVILEKRGRGRGISSLTAQRPWATRLFKLDGQRLEYYDGSLLKGTIATGGATCVKLNSKDADGKPFPLLLDTGKEKIYLNASSEEVRSKCIEVFNFSSDTANWAFEY